MYLTEETLTIQEEVKKLKKKGDKIKAHMIYLVKTPRGATECVIYGDKISRNTIPALGSYSIYDFINAFLYDKMGFDVSVRKDPVYLSPAITLWYKK